MRLSARTQTFGSVPLSRRAFLRTLVVGGSAVLVACQRAADTSVATGPASSGTERWDQIVSAAREEGVLTVYGGPSARRALHEPFQRAFPNIRLDGVYGPGNELVARVVSERQAGRYIPDVLVGPGTSGLTALKPIGALAPAERMLVLPEVLDLSAWFENRLWWADAEEPYTTLSFQGSVQSIVSYNTQMVDPNELRSYWDLLSPKWKGQMIAIDIRTFGPGTVPSRFIYQTLGPTFLRRLLTETDLTLGSDQRQLVDWLAQGRYPLGLFLGHSQLVPAMQQGLPIGIIPGAQFAEGAPIGPGGGSLSILDRAPHPNAATVYVNWVLSREGQIAWQEITAENSLRTDIPKDRVGAFSAPRPGGTYVDAGSESFARQANGDLQELVVQALAGR